MNKIMKGNKNYSCVCNECNNIINNLNFHLCECGKIIFNINKFKNNEKIYCLFCKKTIDKNNKICECKTTILSDNICPNCNKNFNFKNKNNIFNNVLCNCGGKMFYKFEFNSYICINCNNNINLYNYTCNLCSNNMRLINDNNLNNNKCEYCKKTFIGIKSFRCICGLNILINGNINNNIFCRN
jgi:hypothetical protein